MVTSEIKEEATQTTGAAIEVHLSKPGGQREGPFTLAQIKRDLASQKYSDADYWAWHDGMPSWVPLYELPGIAPDAAEPAAEPAPNAPIQTPPGPDEEREAVGHTVAADMPASALDHIFMFTTGNGPDQWRSMTVARMLKEITGEEMSVLREAVPRHVIGGCDVASLLKPNGTLSDAVWDAMASRQPTLVEHARERFYRVCVRTFRLDSDVIVAVILFYNKLKL